MATLMPFADVLDAADHVSTDEKEELIAVLRRRLAEQGRKRVIAEVEESRKEFVAGGCRTVTMDELMHEIERSRT